MTLIEAEGLDHLIDAKLGLIKRVLRVPDYPFGSLPRIPVHIATGAQNLVKGFSASGAGTSEYRAKISAIGEYIERYCAMSPNRSVTLLETLPRGVPSIDLSEFHAVGDVLPTISKWIVGYDIETREPIGVPANLVYLNFIRDSKESIHWVTTATGAAAGNGVQDATYRGLAECFERDAIETMWQNQIQLPRIDYTSYSVLRDFYEKYMRSDGIRYHLFKLVMDHDVPAVFGLAEIDGGGVVAGGAVRCSWLDACEKTFIELAQSLVGYAPLIYRREYKSYEADFSDVRTYDDHNLLYLQPHMREYLGFLLNSSESVVVPMSESPSEPDRKLLMLIDQLKLIHKQAVVVDITGPDIRENGWNVVKVLVPGFTDLEPGARPIFNYARITEVTKKLLTSGLRNPEQIGGRPIAPHPFP